MLDNEVLFGQPDNCSVSGCHGKLDDGFGENMVVIYFYVWI